MNAQTPNLAGQRYALYDYLDGQYRCISPVALTISEARRLFDQTVHDCPEMILSLCICEIDPLSPANNRTVIGEVEL